MTIAPATDTSATIDASSLPLLVVPPPGPASRAIAAREQSLRSPGLSAGASWSQLAIEAGQGAVLRDADGNLLLDACAGTVVMNIGHGHAKIAAAIARQAEALTHFYDFASSSRVRFLGLLGQVVAPELDSFHLANSGAEAVEAALRMARSATGRFEVVAFHNAYHGRSFGALSLTTGAGRHGVGPFLPGVVHTPAPYPFRSPDPAHEVERCVDTFQRTTANVLSAAGPAAVIVEPMQGAGGMIPLPAEFLQFLREYCDRTGAVLIFDEILTGAGRTGTMWAYERAGVVPDMLLAGKGLAGGYPFGLVAARSALASAGPIAEATHNSSTFGGGQMACAAGAACLEVLRDEQLVERSELVGNVVLERLRARLSRNPLVGEVRGLGLAIGVELVVDPVSKQPVSADVVRSLLLGLLARGVVVSSTSHVLRVTPPLCITDEQAAFVVDAIVDTLGELDAGGRA